MAHTILMLLENNPYPRDVRVRQEARTLDRAGHAVIVISPRASDQQYREVIDGVTTYRYPAPPEMNGFAGYVLEYGVAMLAMAILSLYVFARHRFTVIHAHNPPDFMVLIALFYRLFGVRFVFDHHDLAQEMYLTRGGNRRVADVLRFFERLSCRVADQIIVTNESYRQIDIEKNGANSDKITIVRNGPSQELLHPVEADADWKGRAPFLIGYLGEIGVNDGVECLIRSLDHLRRVRADWMCVIIGDGPARADAEQLMGALQLADCVAFVGWKQRSEFLKLLSAMDIGVEPIPKNAYTNYSTMIKITEYMAVGLPIVAFDLEEHRFTAGDCAMYAQPNEERDFAACLAALMDDAEQRRSMSQIARMRIQHLTWQSQEDNLRRVYENVGAKRTAR